MQKNNVYALMNVSSVFIRLLRHFWNCWHCWHSCFIAAVAVWISFGDGVAPLFAFLAFLTPAILCGEHPTQMGATSSVSFFSHFAALLTPLLMTRLFLLLSQMNWRHRCLFPNCEDASRLLRPDFRRRKCLRLQLRWCPVRFRRFRIPPIPRFAAATVKAR